MTCISETKIPNMLKMASNGFIGQNYAVLYYNIRVIDFLLYEYQQNLSNLEENYGKVRAVYKENHMYLGY